MTIFKTFLHVLNKIKITIIIYTLILVVFSFTSLQSSNPINNFAETKPDIIVIDNDNSKLSKNLVKYLESKCHVNKEIDINDKNLVSDSLFHRIISYIIYIPENYKETILENNKPNIEIKQTGDYESSYTEMILKEYLEIVSVYSNLSNNENEIIENIDKNTRTNTNINITSKIDKNNINNLTFYFNFATYSLIACILYIIGVIISIFKDEKINKRTIISSTSYKKVNRLLLLSNLLYAIILWLFYILISCIILKDIMFTQYGLVCIINSFIFTISVTSLAFFITTLINKKEAMTGLVNIISLGQAFLCGAFVPVELLPSKVLTVAHILPAYYYINSNELLKTIEIINLETLKPIIQNNIILIGFSILFIILSNIVTKIKNN
ncbi:MAG: ABC transporter permease [Bacilli bacterium]|nr:ABC transporter permease [Bacilli bacterium]